MKDADGLYYYPNPANKKIRMYVRMQEGEVCFRMKNDEDPQLWEKHGWIPYDAVVAASLMEKNKRFNPLKVYDIALAEELLREAAESEFST